MTVLRDKCSATELERTKLLLKLEGDVKESQAGGTDKGRVVGLGASGRGGATCSGAQKGAIESTVDTDYCYLSQRCRTVCS